MGSFETLPVGDTTARLYVAGDQGSGVPGVLVLHAWWGLVDDVLAFADRLAGEGFVVMAPDLFGGRTAATPDEAEALTSGVDEAGVDERVLAAVDALAALAPEGSGIGIVGFSFGAAYALWAPSKRESIAATVAYYGTMLGPSLAKSGAPVLGHFAEQDEFEPDEGVTALEDALREARRQVTIHRYPGTGHWFAEPSRSAYVPDAAELAFARTVSFLREALEG